MRNMGMREYGNKGAWMSKEMNGYAWIAVPNDTCFYW